MMRVLGGWMALTPELPAKLLFGAQVWAGAQHAAVGGRRLPELRAAAQQSAPANDAMVAFMEMLESPEGPRQTLERVVGVYTVLKPHLVTVYARHLGGTNAVYEPPTRRILARCLEEERRHAAAGAIVLARLAPDAAGRARVADWERRLLGTLEKAGGVTGGGTAPPGLPPLLRRAPRHSSPGPTPVPPDRPPPPPPPAPPPSADPPS